MSAIASPESIMSLAFHAYFGRQFTASLYRIRPAAEMDLVIQMLADALKRSAANIEDSKVRKQIQGLLATTMRRSGKKIQTFKAMRGVGVSSGGGSCFDRRFEELKESSAAYGLAVSEKKLRLLMELEDIFRAQAKADCEKEGFILRLLTKSLPQTVITGLSGLVGYAVGPLIDAPKTAVLGVAETAGMMGDSLFSALGSIGSFWSGPVPADIAAATTATNPIESVLYQDWASWARSITGDLFERIGYDKARMSIQVLSFVLAFVALNVLVGVNELFKRGITVGWTGISTHPAGIQTIPGNLLEASGKQRASIESIVPRASARAMARARSKSKSKRSTSRGRTRRIKNTANKANKANNTRNNKSG